MLGNCENCNARKEWMKANPVPCAALAGVLILITVVIVKGR